MNEQLRPASLGEILDRTAQLYRSRFLLFLGISVVPTGVVVALACVIALPVAWWIRAGAGSVSEGAGYVLVALFCCVVTLVALPILLAATALAMAAMSHAVSRVHMGEMTTIRDAYLSVWRRGWRYIWLCVLQGLLIGVAPMAAWIVLLVFVTGGAALAKTAGAAGVVGGVLVGLIVVLVAVALLGYVFWMLLRLSMAFPACVVEQIGAWPAIKRSSLLSNGTKGRIFVLYLLVGVLSYLISIGVTLPLTIILTVFFSAGDPQHAQAAAVVLVIITYSAAFAVQALIRPIYGIAFVLFYYDQRIRKEGFDIEWMMQKAGMVAPAAATEAAPWLAAAPSKQQPVEAESAQDGETA